MEINLKNKKTLANINKLFNGRNDAAKFVDGCGSMIYEAKGKAAEEEPKPEPRNAETNHEKFINEI